VSDSLTTATPETKSAAPMAHPPVRENQMEAEVDRSQVAGQRVMRSMGGGSPAAPPEQFAGALGEVSGRSQTGMLRQLQRSYGNSYVGDVIQAKLTVSQPGDIHEQEADLISKQVISTNPSSSFKIDRKSEEEKIEEVQTKPLVNTITPIVQRQDVEEKEEEEEEKEEEIQRSTNGVVQAQADLESRLNANKGGGSSLPDEVRSFMEPSFGADFSQVRVHNDSAAAQMNQELGAEAFTHGRDVYFGAGKSPRKDLLTAHELTHVVQQTGAILPSRDLQKQPLKNLDRISASNLINRKSSEDERADQVRSAFNEAVLEEHWDEAAVILNGLNNDDISRKLEKLSTTQLEKMRGGVIRKLRDWPHFNDIQEFIDKAILKSSQKANRADFVRTDFERAVNTENWDQAAIIFNGFNEDDIERRLKTMSGKQLFNLRTGVLNKLQGWPRYKYFIDQIEGQSTKTLEKERITKINDDYENSIKNAKTGQGSWKEVVQILNGFNDDDIEKKLDDLSTEELQLLDQSSDSERIFYAITEQSYKRGEFEVDPNAIEVSRIFTDEILKDIHGGKTTAAIKVLNFLSSLSDEEIEKALVNLDLETLKILQKEHSKQPKLGPLFDTVAGVDRLQIYIGAAIASLQPQAEGYDASQVIHLALDLLGLIPVYGEIFDGVNAFIYLMEGDDEMAAVSLAAMVPILGISATVGKFGIKAAKATKVGLSVEKTALKISAKAVETAGVKGIAKALSAATKAVARAESSKIAQLGVSLLKGGVKTAIEIELQGLLKEIIQDFISVFREWSKDEFKDDGFDTLDAKEEEDEIVVYGTYNPKIKVVSISKFDLNKTPVLQQLIRNRKTALTQARNLRKSSKKLAVQALASAKKQRGIKLSAKIGEHNARLVMRKEFPNAKILLEGQGSGVFDFIYREGDKIIIAEAKGGSGKRGTRIYKKTGKEVKQGEKDYVLSILDDMKDTTLAKEIRDKLANNQVSYIEIAARGLGKSQPTVKFTKFF
jgi:hypothetical protein